MKTHRVRANAGYISEPMSRSEAINYAFNLRRLGNYNVKIERER